MKWRWKFGKWNIRKKYIQCFSKSCIIHPASEELGIYIHQQRKTAEGIVCKYPISGLKSRSVCRGEVVQSRFCSAGSFGTQILFHYIYIPLYFTYGCLMLYLTLDLSSMCLCGNRTPLLRCFGCLSLLVPALWEDCKLEAPAISPSGGAFSQAKPKA